MSKTRDLALLAAGAAMANRSAPAEYRRVPQVVHEHRAPTDESVKLLKEMEEKALAKLDETIRIEGNGFNAVIHIIQKEWDDSTMARAVFTLNGKRHVVEHSLGDRELSQDDRMTLLTGLRDKVATVVAGQIIVSDFPRMPHRFPAA